MRRVRHFPTDVIAGAALGVVVGAGTHYAFRRRQRRADHVDAPTDARAQGATVAASSS
jgi:membrane-associated phospholipid phosphatase